MKTTLKNIFIRIPFVFWLSLITIFLFFPGCTSSKANQISENSEPSGKIVFQWVKDYRMNKMLHFVDGNGQNILYIADFNGSPAFSPDGNQIAVRCPSRYDLSLQAYISTEICLLDINEENDSYNKFSEYLSQTIQNTPKLTLPELCWDYEYSHKDELSRYEGVLSMTWSPQADTLAVVCGDRVNSEVCFLPLEGESWCWDQASALGVFRVAWSPVDENTLVVSGVWPEESEIFLVEGNTKKYLSTGFSPEWSPDGSQIAFIEKIPGISEDDPHFGIAVISPDGSGHKWLYQPDADKPETYIYLDQNGSEGQVEANRLSWSPDGGYLVFTGLHDGTEGSRLYRLEISTGKIILLLNPAVFTGWITEADWGAELVRVRSLFDRIILSVFSGPFPSKK